MFKSDILWLLSLSVDYIKIRYRSDAGSVGLSSVLYKGSVETMRIFTGGLK